MKYLRICKKIKEVGFDDFHQAGSPNVFSKMNIVAESRVLNKQFWVCISGGYRCKDLYYIASRPLDNTNARTERDYCRNQSEMLDKLEKIKALIQKNGLSKGDFYG